MNISAEAMKAALKVAMTVPPPHMNKCRMCEREYDESLMCVPCLIESIDKHLRSLPTFVAKRRTPQLLFYAVHVLKLLTQKVGDP